MIRGGMRVMTAPTSARNRPAIEIADILRRHGDAYRRGPCRSSRSRRAARDERDRGVPHRGARRPRRGLRRLRHDARRLQFLPQSALSEVSGPSPSRVARRARSRPAAGSLFPCRLHLAGADRRDRLPEQGHRLCDPVQSRRRGNDRRSPPIRAGSAPRSASSPSCTPGDRR